MQPSKRRRKEWKIVESLTQLELSQRPLWINPANLVSPPQFRTPKEILQFEPPLSHFVPSAAREPSRKRSPSSKRPSKRSKKSSTSKQNIESSQIPSIMNDGFIGPDNGGFIGPDDGSGGFPSLARDYDVDNNINWTLTTHNIETMKEKLVPEYWERLQFEVYAAVRVTTRLYVLQDWDLSGYLKVLAMMNSSYMSRSVNIYTFTEW